MDNANGGIVNLCYSVYQIENKINGKTYIGMTGRSVATRFREHCRPLDRFISRQIQKAGADNFVVHTIATFDTEREAREYETYCILKNKSQDPNGYNICCNGDIARFYALEIVGGQLNLFKN